MERSLLTLVSLGSFPSVPSLSLLLMRRASPGVLSGSWFSAACIMETCTGWLLSEWVLVAWMPFHWVTALVSSFVCFVQALSFSFCLYPFGHFFGLHFLQRVDREGKKDEPEIILLFVNNSDKERVPYKRLTPAWAEVTGLHLSSLLFLPLLMLKGRLLFSMLSSCFLFSS